MRVSDPYYASVQAERDRKAALADRVTPRAAALRDQIGRAPYDAEMVNARGWAYSAACARVHSGEDFTETEALVLRAKAHLPIGGAR